MQRSSPSLHPCPWVSSSKHVLHGLSAHRKESYDAAVNTLPFSTAGTSLPFAEAATLQLPAAVSPLSAAVTLTDAVSKPVLPTVVTMPTSAKVGEKSFRPCPWGNSSRRVNFQPVNAAVFKLHAQSEGVDVSVASRSLVLGKEAAVPATLSSGIVNASRPLIGVVASLSAAKTGLSAVMGDAAAAAMASMAAVVQPRPASSLQTILPSANKSFEVATGTETSKQSTVPASSKPSVSLAVPKSFAAALEVLRRLKGKRHCLPQQKGCAAIG